MYEPNPSDAQGRFVNRVLGILFLAAALFQLVVLPAWLLPASPAWGWLLLVPVLLSNAWWAYLHEAVHGGLSPSRAGNRRLGRLHAVLYGAPFDLLRAGHLLHHALSRTVRERSEVYRAGHDNRALFAVAYYLRILGGLYLIEVLGGLLFLLPHRAIATLAGRLERPDNVVPELVRRVSAPAILRAVRLDAGAVLAMYGLAFALYGRQAWLLLLALAGRALLVSLVDNAFHYGTALNRVRAARNLALPGWASALILHFNLHGAHHLRPGLPWWRLPDYHRSAGSGYQAAWWPALFAQLRGPIPEHRLRP
ncbi:fatty acid desaturase [Parasulfuritortus cantonensis]|uniref:Fatty acid desaturase n=1 Tax=Parasulfuritortus cantonensis TaxID=2528202 RepID=A0A4R1B6F0_9PROT|nr:fatty acid desaturase [Parasulfuritortus cantonensis]TCJ11818.1 fatty acid desaturase [Parasulfuritortus cantonensis]